MKPRLVDIFHHLGRSASVQIYTVLLSVMVSIAPYATVAEIHKPLLLPEVLTSVANQYPPYLSALIERDIASGRARSALGAMDLQTYLRLFQNPTGFYESTTTEAGFEQFTNLRGATIFGGYRYTEGFLPDYYRTQRTDAGGTPTLGVRLPLLRNGTIDPRRAAIYRAKIDQELANPIIQSQHLNLSLATMRTYYHWLAAGQKLAVNESLLAVAQKRDQAIQTQITQGLVAPITALENQQLVVSRKLAVTKARRNLEAATAALSLFFRTMEGEPDIVAANRLPQSFPSPLPLPSEALSAALQHASTTRPEVRIFELKLEKLNVDTRLFRNQLQPQLNAFVAASQSLGNQQYKDTDQFELELGFQFNMPLQRNQAKGNLQVNAAKIKQLQLEAQFALDRIATDVWNAHSAVQAAVEQVQHAAENVDLANQLHQVEQDRFALGAVDFLPLQLREQRAFEARLNEVDILNNYHVALTSLIGAIGIDPRRIAQESNPHLMQFITNL